MNRDLIYRITDYFGIAYYGFLALYALYEFIFSAAYVSIVVIAPLFYALVFLAGSSVLIFFLNVYEATLDSRRRKALLKEAWGHIWVAILSILAAVGPVVAFSLREKPMNLFGGYSLVFFFFTIVEILSRSSFTNTLKKDKEIRFSKRLDRLFSAYPTGAIALLGIFFGFWLIIIISTPPENLFTEVTLTAIVFYFLTFFFYVDWLNKKALRWWKKQRPYQRSSLSSKLEFWSKRHPSRPRLWPFWTSFLLTAIFTLLAYYYLGQLFSQITSRRLFILLFAGIYAIIAWHRWKEVKQLRSKEV